MAAHSVVSPAVPVFDLEAYGAAPALLTCGPTEGVISYVDLADRAADVAAAWGHDRRLVLIRMRNDLDSVVSYLAALQHGHVPLLVPGDRHDAARHVLERYVPDVVCDGPDRRVDHSGVVHDLHPDLALLLSTSGSTGSPRLVRLSADNVRSNARAIAEYLELTPDDRAVTSLPLHYCYGLSVLHSHLAVGASVLLSELSVVDACFWDLVERTGVTSLAAVPHTVDLLERSGFADRRVPSLRRLTQAGGRLDAATVRSLAQRGAEQGWDLHVMYGQTEATARIAHLPPQLAAVRPEAVGIAIPGGSLRIEPVAGEPDGVGELVYQGPNVMLGYADRPVDLARGAELSELRTGDLARIRDGLVEIVGRSSRRAKLFGLRLDLDRLETLLASDGFAVPVVADDRLLHAFVTTPTDLTAVAARLASHAGVPTTSVRCHGLTAIPRTSSGKVDRAALGDLAALAHLEGHADAGPDGSSSVRDQIALVLGRPDAGPQDTFAALGGDSLSYVEVATRLAPLFGAGLPVDWHTLPIGVLEERAASAPRRTRAGRRSWLPTDTTIVLRAVAVLMILCTHADLVSLQGGAHVLLVVAGYNFARFQLGTSAHAARLRNIVAGLAQVALPAAAWIGAVSLLTGFYRPATALLLNGLLGRDRWDVQWQFWFLEALVWTTAGLLAVLAVPAVHRLERRAPLGFALAALAVTGALRFALVEGVEAGPTQRYSVPVVACFFVLGWAAARARGTLARLVVGAAAVILVTGFFGEPRRELIVGCGVLLLWVPTVPVPRALARPLGTLASASLCIYLTQWQVYPRLEAAGLPVVAVAASVCVGIGYAALARPAQRLVAGAVRRGSRTRASRAGSPAYQHPRPRRRVGAACP